jgi:hypothetical protein
LLLIPSLLLVGCPEDDDDDAATMGAKMIAVGDEDGAAVPVILTTPDTKTWTRVTPTVATWATDVDSLNNVKRFNISTLNRTFALGTLTSGNSTIWYSDTPTDAATWTKATINWASDADMPAVTAVAVTAVTASDLAATPKVYGTFTVASDLTASLMDGRLISIAGSDNNNSDFTVRSAVFGTTDTVITVEEAVVAETTNFGNLSSDAFTSTWIDDHSTQPIRNICMVTETIGFAVGEESMFLYTNDGGVTWHEGNRRIETTGSSYFNWRNFDSDDAYTLAVKFVTGVGYFVLIGTDDGIWMVAIAEADITTPDVKNWVWTDNTVMAGTNVNLDYDEIQSIYLHEETTNLFVLAMGYSHQYHFQLTLPATIDAVPTIGAVTEADLSAYTFSNYIEVTSGTTTWLYYAGYSSDIFRIDVAELDATYAAADWVTLPAANIKLSSWYVYTYGANILLYKNTTAYIIDESTTTGDWGYCTTLGATLGTTPETEYWFDYDDDPLPDNAITDVSTLTRIETLATGELAGAGTCYDLTSWELLD